MTSHSWDIFLFTLFKAGDEVYYAGSLDSLVRIGADRSRMCELIGQREPFIQ
jgi:hypothetical protein